MGMVNNHLQLTLKTNMITITPGIIIVFLLLFLNGILPIPGFLSHAFAQTENDNPTESKPDEKGIVDSAHETVSQQVQNAANWVDSFFGDRRHEAEVNQTQLRLRLSLSKKKEED